jgi:hypothetical protein
MLVEIRSAIWNVHRMGFSNSLQHKDLDSAMVFITAMYRAIPVEYRKDLPPRPMVNKMQDHLALKRNQWEWISEGIGIVEETISEWIDITLQKSARL